MVVPGFATNLISGRQCVCGWKEGSNNSNELRDMLEFEMGSDGMAYLIAFHIQGGDNGIFKKR